MRQTAGCRKRRYLRRRLRVFLPIFELSSLYCFMKKILLAACSSLLLLSCGKEQTYTCRCVNNGTDLGSTNIQAKKRTDAQSDCDGVQTTWRRKGTAYSATVCVVPY